MAETLRWAGAIGFLAVFLVCAFANLDNLFGFLKSTRERKLAAGSRTSPAMLVGGITGAIACWLWPEPDLRAFFWVPALIDFPGTFGIGRAGTYVAPDTRSPEARARDDARQAAAEEEARLRREALDRRVKALERSLPGCILGTAVGDALGLACEGLSPQRRPKLFPDPSRYGLLPFGRGMCSDDTEHTVMLAQSILDLNVLYGDDEVLAREVMGSFAWRLRLWLLGLPAGVGMATARAILKLWLFIPPRWSGVNSAGNGPSMRSALLGLRYADQPARMRAMVRAATRITHTDPKAEQAAWTVAMAAAHCEATLGRPDAAGFLGECRNGLGADAAEWIALLERVAASIRKGQKTLEFAAEFGLGKGVTGYSFHTVPVALHAWLSHPADFRGAVIAAIECGGDTDTVAAITGAIAGAGVGKDGIPREWLDRLVEWPRTIAWMEQVALQLAKRADERLVQREPTPGVGAIKLLLRNVFFLAVVLGHGFRRLLPPY